MESEYDYIIIGQGLAGSALSLLLKNAGARIFVVASPQYPAASEVAGGIINPIVLKRYTATWKEDAFFNAAIDFYSAFETTANTEFLYRRNLLKIVGSIQESDFFLTKRKSEKILQDFTDPEIVPNNAKAINAPLGFIKLNGIAQLNTTLYLHAVREYLKDANCFAEEEFLPRKVEFLADGIRYGARKAKKIILCTGWYEHLLPWFSFLRFSFVKGELLRVELPGIKFEEILKHKVYVIPQPDGTYLAGATYEWNTLDNNPTDKGQSQLLGDLKKLFNSEIKISAHYAGVRPATYDRRPFAGHHPEHKNMYIFNGLGTRGAMQSPLLAAYVRDELLEGKSVPAEMDLRRCLE